MTAMQSHRAHIRQMLRGEHPLPSRPSDRRRAEHVADSCESDVPTPEEIDPSLLSRFDCDADRGYLDVFGAVRAV